MDNLTWREKIEKFKLPIGLSIVGVVLIIGGMLLNKPKSPIGDLPKESLVQTQKLFSVDVSGAVNQPGVYKLNEGARIEDAVKVAGGFTLDANQEYISKSLNLAQKIADGSKIYVPLEGEQPARIATQSVAGGGPDSPGVNATVNINNATQAELEALPGVGPVTASKIISDRPYQTIDDLLNKKVVGQSVFNKIKDQIVLY